MFILYLSCYVQIIRYKLSFIQSCITFTESQRKSLSALIHFPIYFIYSTYTYFQNILLKSFLVRFSLKFHQLKALLIRVYFDIFTYFLNFYDLSTNVNSWMLSSLSLMLSLLSSPFLLLLSLFSLLLSLLSQFSSLSPPFSLLIFHLFPRCYLQCNKFCYFITMIHITEHMFRLI